MILKLGTAKEFSTASKIHPLYMTNPWIEIKLSCLNIYLFQGPCPWKPPWHIYIKICFCWHLREPFTLYCLCGTRWPKLDWQRIESLRQYKSAFTKMDTNQLPFGQEVLSTSYTMLYNIHARLGFLFGLVGFFFTFSSLTVNQ